MTTEVAEPPLSVADARRARVEAFARLRTFGAAYDQARRGVRLTDVTRSRSDWGLGVLEVIEACVAEAEAEDRVDPVAAAFRWRNSASPAGSSHGECDRAWRDYQEIRKTGDLAAITAARDAWRVALVDWAQALAARFAVEDQQRVAQKAAWLDDADRVNPGDAFPVQPATRRQQIVRDSRERERRDALRRDKMRDGGLPGWQPASRRPPRP